MAVSLGSVRRKGPFVIGIMAAGAIFTILALQRGAGDNEVVFGRDSKIFFDWVRQYLMARWTALDRSEVFSHDEYYIDRLLEQQHASVDRLSGDARSIAASRAATLEMIRENVLRYNLTTAPLGNSEFNDPEKLVSRSVLEARVEVLRDCLEGIVRLREFEGQMNALFTAHMRRREVPDWKIERELRFSEAPYLTELRDIWRTLMYVRQQEVEMRLGRFNLLLSHFGNWRPTGQANLDFDDPQAGADAGDLNEKVEKLRLRQLVLLRNMRFYKKRQITVQ